MDLAAGVRRQFRVKIVIVPIVLGALGTVPAKLSKSLEKLEIDNVIGSLQTAVLISTTAILKSLRYGLRLYIYIYIHIYIYIYIYICY